MGIMIVASAIMYGLCGALIGLGVGGLLALVLKLILAKQDGWLEVLRVFCLGTFVVSGPIVGFYIGWNFGLNNIEFAH